MPHTRVHACDAMHRFCGFGAYSSISCPSALGEQVAGQGSSVLQDATARLEEAEAGSSPMLFVGAAGGGALALLCALVCCCRRRARSKREAEKEAAAAALKKPFDKPFDKHFDDGHLEEEDSKVGTFAGIHTCRQAGHLGKRVVTRKTTLGRAALMRQGTIPSAISTQRSMKRVGTKVGEFVARKGNTLITSSLKAQRQMYRITRAPAQRSGSEQKDGTSLRMDELDDEDHEVRARAWGYIWVWVGLDSGLDWNQGSG